MMKLLVFSPLRCECRQSYFNYTQHELLDKKERLQRIKQKLILWETYNKHSLYIWMLTPLVLKRFTLWQ
jgi:hypothetical protein